MGFKKTALDKTNPLASLNCQVGREKQFHLVSLRNLKAHKRSVAEKQMTKAFLLLHNQFHMFHPTRVARVAPEEFFQLVATVSSLENWWATSFSWKFVLVYKKGT